MTTKVEKDEALDRIREWVKPGDTVHCILRHVSSSGMTRVIQLVKFVDGEARYLGYNAAIALGLPYDRKREGVKMQGCGMDMGFSLVYELSHALFPNGFGIEGTATGDYDGELRPQSRERAEFMRTQLGIKFRGRNGDTSGWENDGGYALNHRWL